MTPSKKRLLLAHGIGTLTALASLDKGAIGALAEQGVATDGLRQLQKQAEALLTRRTIDQGRRTGPALSSGREHLLVAEWDPLGAGGPFQLGWAVRAGRSRPFEQRDVSLCFERGESARLCDALLGWVGSGDERIVHYGASVPRAVDWLLARAPSRAEHLGGMERRFLDLAPLVRRGAYLPVRRYEFAEVVAAVRGETLPALSMPVDAPFVWAENLRLGVEGDWERKIRDRTWSDLEGLATLSDRMQSDRGTETP